MRILLVEDDPHTAGFIAKGLKEDGHTVDHTDNGKDGLFLATTEHYDAIVKSGHQPVFAFWHGRILPATYFWRRRSIVVITSENFDGEWIAGIIERFGYGTARGSTSRSRTDASRVGSADESSVESASGQSKGGGD